MKTIEVNNGQKIRISSTDKGIVITMPNSIETYSDSEIVTALNMFNYMRRYGMDTAYLIDLETSEMIDFRIF